MFRPSVIATAIGGLFVASPSFAGFTLTANPSAQSATGAGLFAYDIFAQNDADPADGVNLQGLAITVTAFGTTKIKLSNFDDGTGFLGDAWNFGSGAQQNTIVDLNASNFRIGTRSASQHTFTDYTGDGTPYLTADQAANGLSSFTADYAVLSAATSVPAGTAPGARFARVVVSGGRQFTLSGSFGGEVGSKSFASLGGVPPPPSNVPPVVIPGSTSAVVFGQIVTSGAPFSVVVNVTDADATNVLSLTVGATAGISNVTVVGGGASPEAFTITGTVDYSLNGSVVVVPVTASDGAGGTGTGSFTLVVTPEPGSILSLGLMSLFCRRARARILA